MTTASIQDIDTFIRMQKEKLNRDRNVDPYSQQMQQQNSNYNRQLDNYMNSMPRSSGPDYYGQPSSQYPQQQQPQQQQQQPAQYRQPEQFVDNTQRSNSPILLNQQKQQDIPTHRITKQYKDNNEQENFFERFGQYENKRNRLKNEMQNEYNQYINQKNAFDRQKKNEMPVSNEYYATLPLKGMEKHSGSQDNLSNIRNQQNDIKSRSYYDVTSAQNQQFNNSTRGYDMGGADMYNGIRTLSANSLENLRPMPVEAYRAPLPPAPTGSGVDPSLTDILRRPPVGLRSTPVVPNVSSRVQFSNNVRMNEYQSQAPINNNFPFNDSLRTTQQSMSNQQLANPSTTGFNFSENQNKDIKQMKAKEYQDELARQVREKQLAKQKEREEKERLERKIAVENANFNPFGRSGGGAPLKDRDGNIMADLSQVKADPAQYSPRSLAMAPPAPGMYAPNAFSSNMPPSMTENYGSMPPYLFDQTSSRVNAKSKTGSNDEPSFARGGNGIFGEAKSEDQKKQEEKYKAELQRQIEEKQRQKMMEKEKERIEEEKEQRRIAEQQKRIQAELDEEERKKKAKEDAERQQAENAKRLIEERKKAENTRKPKIVGGRKVLADDDDQSQPSTAAANRGSFQATEFRSNSPPVPAAAKKAGGGGAAPSNDTRNYSPPPPKPQKKKPPVSNATADYYNTESRLNLASPSNKNNNKKLVDDVNLVNERVPSELIIDYPNSSYNEKNTQGDNTPPVKKPAPRAPPKSTNRQTNKNFDNPIPNKPVLRKVASRPASQVSTNSELLNQIHNLKKHLHNEQIEIENALHNSNNMTTVGQLADIHHTILNVRTPPGDLARNRNNLFDNPQRTYRKDFDTPPINGGLEPRTYFRENSSVLLGNNDDMFSNGLQREADERQMGRLNMLKNDSNYNLDQLTARNNQRLRKLRDIEDDSLSMADPNDVLNKFLNKNTSLFA